MTDVTYRHRRGKIFYTNQLHLILSTRLIYILNIDFQLYNLVSPRPTIHFCFSSLVNFLKSSSHSQFSTTTNIPIIVLRTSTTVSRTNQHKAWSVAADRGTAADRESDQDDEATDANQ